MRHLTTEELLLYAEGELGDRALCRHVWDCVDCKAQLVDVQETYFHAASAIRAQAVDLGAQPSQLHRLRVRLAEEAELLAAHLDTEDLLISVESELEGDRQAHLATCVACQDRAADLHIRLAEIECELHSRLAYELPTERRAAALAALRKRLAKEVEAKTAARLGRWDWVPRLTLPRIPAFASLASAAAMAVLVAWVGWNAISGPDGPSVQPGVQTAAVVLPAPAPALGPPLATDQVARPDPVAVGSRGFARFSVEPVHNVPPALELLIATRAPDLEAAPVAMPAFLGLALPRSSDLPVPQAEPPVELAVAVPVSLPVRAVPPAPESLAAVTQGSWLLAKTGLWKESLEPGGSDGLIRFAGIVDTDRDRIEIENKLREASDWPLAFSIGVRPALATPSRPLAPVSNMDRPSGGLVRTSLLRHYEDSARRSFRPLDRGRLEDELDRYVSGVFRAESEMLAHVHALHSLLNRPGIASVREMDAFQKVVKFHLRGILDREDGIYRQLREVLPRQYWGYSGLRAESPDGSSLGALSRDLLADTLALDRVLTAMFFGTSATIDARETNLSSADLLKQVRRRALQLRAALR